MSANSRIAKNTVALYFRQILILLVSLYTVRVVLATLGEEDYGIYSVVAGVVTMFGFLSGAMASAGQRFFSFEMGKGKTEEEKAAGLSRIFSATCTIYALICAAVLILAETFGLYFVNHALVIPPQRMAAANVIYQCAVCSFLFSVMASPYMSAIIAHENMDVYAYASIAEALMKLAVVLILKVFEADKLSLYGVLLLIVSVANTSIYRLYCRKNYRECRFHISLNRSLLSEIAGYALWNTFGAAVGVFKNQIVNILLNQFFGAAVNAARAIASQVSAAVTSFSQNFSTALKPQIIKTYAANEKAECENLVLRGCKMTFFLMLLFTLSLELEMPFVLKLWLKNPPEHACLFARLVLFDALLDSVSYPVMTLAQATGKIKFYQGVVGGILLLNFPASYICLECGLPAFSVLVAAISLTFIAFAARLLIVRRLASLSLKTFAKRVCLPCIFVFFLSLAASLPAEIFLPGGILKFCAVVFLSAAEVCLLVLFLGMSRAERKSLFIFIRKRFFHA